MRSAWQVLIGAAVLLAGCSGSTGEVSTSIGAFTAPYLAVDLASGQLESYASLTESEVRTDVRWKTTKLLFRRIEIGGSVGQSSADLGADADEPTPHNVASGILFVAVFELTQAQWTALGGTARWLEPGLRAAGGSVVDPQAPAFGLSRDEVTAVMASFNTGRIDHLALPTNDQWELLCRGGNTGAIFWWGDDPAGVNAVVGTPPVAVVRAVVADNAGGVTGPHAVTADRAANPLGLYDVHGNVWEWVDSINGTVRGGSWNDTVTMARAANRLALDQAVHHPLVGARLILVP
jgi:formylglycine-generating enzyme required for sulfatase activity